MIYHDRLEADREATKKKDSTNGAKGCANDANKMIYHDCLAV